MENVIVKGAPGFADFLATAVPGLGRIPVDDDRQFLAVVHDGTGFPLVIPMRHVHPLSADEQSRIRNARLYRAEWSVKTGRSEREVYIPKAIRPHTVEEY